MKKLLYLFLLVLPTLASAQNRFKISGHVLEANSQIPVPFSSIRIQKANSTQVVSGGITDEKGLFSFDTPTGIYDVLIESIGFEAKKLSGIEIIKATALGNIEVKASTKTKGLADYTKVMEMRANTSNNTVYADNQGNIAYWHGNFVPRRDATKDWGLPQDGSTSANDWKGLHALNEIVQVINPETAWIQNCNSTPFTVSGTSSPKRANFPVYMAPDGENFRDKNAVRLFSEAQRLDLNGLIKLGYDRHLAAFPVLIPALIRDFDAKPVEALRPLIDTLRHWDYQARNASVAQTLAVRWGLKLLPKIPKPVVFGGLTDPVKNFTAYASNHQPAETVEALGAVYADLIRDFGQWNVSWGEMNRFQRLTDYPSFDDSKPSIAVPFTSSAWGQLPSYTSRPFQGSKKWYGVNGNSFVCAVEFGKKIKAYSLLAGGQQGDPASPHFFDQAQQYADGKFKEVLFYKEDVLKHVEKRYKLD